MMKLQLFLAIVANKQKAFKVIEESQ